MTSPTDAHLERLVRALADVPDDRAAALVSEAWEQAATEVRETLATAMQAALLRQAVGILEHGEGVAADPGQAAPAGRPAVAEADDGPVSGRKGDTDLVWYAYAVTGPETPARLDDVEPMTPGHPLEVVRAGGLCVLASPVPAAEFGPDALAERLGDLAWLEDTARRHDAALHGLLDAGEFVPLRFCTIVRDREDLAGFLDVHADALRSALDVVAGGREWGVKVSVEPERLHAHLRASDDELRDLDEKAHGQTGGQAYFLDKRISGKLRQRAEELAVSEAGQLHERLHELVAASDLLPLQRQEAETTRGRLVLNGAYLVADEQWEGFEREVRRSAERWRPVGLSVELTGPWPPYSFVDLDLATDATG